MPKDELKKVLIESRIVSEQDFEVAAAAASEGNISIEKSLIEKKIITEVELGQTIARYLGFPFIDLNHESILDSYLAYLPEPVAVAKQALIFDETDTGFKIATSNPKNYQLAKDLEKVVGKISEVYYAPPTAIEKFLLFYKNNLPQDFRDFVNNFKKTGNDEIIVKMLNRVVSYAYENKASDIHIEPSIEEVGIRVRIDGLLRRVATYPTDLHPKIVFLIKIKAHLKTDEHGMTQDGRFSHAVGKERFDIRVSILPVTNGENVVMRVLSEKSRRLSLEDLGLMDEDLKKIKDFIKKPNGMIVSTGATGSGKTTTLYAILQLVDKKKLNVVTIEDPVEYAMEGVQQIQVNEKKNLTFANGLRSIVRQDPDMIMVGEIRDDETASIAINAALTGHTLFTSLHANDTATTFSRLLELKIEKNLVATSLSMIVSQRLVRKVCNYCKSGRKATDGEIAFIKANPNLNKVLQNEFYGKGLDVENLEFYSGNGCSMCGNTGFSGRLGIFEIMEMNDEIREMVTRGEISQNIKKRAIEMGMKTIEYWELYHLLNGTTTLEELLNPIA